jgi:hypothetical protein
MSVSGSSKSCGPRVSPRYFARYSAVRLTQIPSSAVSARGTGAAWTLGPLRAHAQRIWTRAQFFAVPWMS